MITTRTVMSFALGGLGSAVIWVGYSLLSDDVFQEIPDDAVSLSLKKRQQRGYSPEILEELRSVETDHDRLSLMEVVMGWFPQEIKKALKEADPKSGSAELNFEYEILLLSWAQSDPEGALQWAWENMSLRSGQGVSWYHSYRLIGPEWAFSDPVSFSQYLLNHRGEENSDASSQASEEPSEPIIKIDGNEYEWLVRGNNPLAFMHVYHHDRHNGVGAPQSFVDSLKTIEDFKKVLGTWETLTPESKERFQDEITQKRERLAGLVQGAPDFINAKNRLKHVEDQERRALEPRHNALVEKIIRKWKQLDQKKFESSRFVKWDRFRKPES